MKATAIAPSNIAFIKYWGKKNEVLRLPENGSISMNLSNLLTITTVEFSQDYKDDEIIINKKKEQNESSRAKKHLDRIRNLANISFKAKVVSKNNFPTGTGLSSSASGFAALTVAASNAAAAGSKAASLELTEKELSILARQGSGSACRSIPDGFVEWLDGDTSETSYSFSLYEPDYWQIADIVAVVSKNKKEVSSTEGQKLVHSSPFFTVRLSRMEEKIKLVKKYLKERDFTKFGELVEAEALEMHTIMMSSTPSLLYLLPASLKIMHLVKKWRQEGLESYFTVNTGQDIHIICQKKDVQKVTALVKETPEVKEVIVNSPAKGARLVPEHLF